jgi:hypothetical protein
MEDMVEDFDDARDLDDEMEESAKAFNDMLESSKRPLHGHTELCQLDAIAQVMALKAQFNLGESITASASSAKAWAGSSRAVRA